jgi:hypothetical protein
MSGFNSLAHVHQLGKRKWVLTRPLTYTSPAGHKFTVPKGFETDGASFPPGVRNILKPMGGHWPRAAILHDYLYDLLNQRKPHPYAKTRQEADRLFCQALAAEGVFPVFKIAMCAAVSLFGGSPLKNWVTK